MPEESPETAGRGTAFHLHTTLQSTLDTYGFAFPVPIPELVPANDLLSFTLYGLVNIFVGKNRHI